MQPALNSSTTGCYFIFIFTRTVCAKGLPERLKGSSLEEDPVMSSFRRADKGASKWTANASLASFVNSASSLVAAAATILSEAPF